MSLFDDMLGHEESLFQNPGVLDQDYLPKILPHREGEMEQIASAVKEIPGGGRNLLIYGESGLGKTACIRHVFRELRLKSDDYLPLYINVWKKDTFGKIVSKLCDELEIIQRKRPVEKLWDAVLKKIDNWEGVALALDEIDKAEEEFLYKFLEDLSHKSIFLATTQRNWTASLDQRIRSRLAPTTLRFEPYSRDEVEDILEQRKEHAFVPDVWSEEAFQSVVSACYDQEDLRFGISLLKKAALQAEEEASRKIEEEHVKEVLETKIEEGDETLDKYI